jgi:diguanylate cyclase (GGDEF)-like protein/PAS domain S-box-containing protein
MAHAEGVPPEPGADARSLRGGVAGESEERYSRLVALSPDAVVLSVEGKVAAINPAGLRLLKAPDEASLLGKPLIELFEPLAWSVVERRLLQMHERDAATSFSEVRLLRQDGSLIEVEMGAAPVRYQGKAAAQILFRDLTLYARVSELLKNSEVLYHSLVENLPQNVFRKDLGGRFTFANERFCATLGKPLPEILGKTDYDFYPRALAEKYLKDDARLIEAGETIDTVEEHHSPGKPKSFVHVVKTPLYDAQHQVIGIQGIFRDVTAQKRQEEALSHLAYYDALTGLPNRSLFMDRLGQTMKRTRRRKYKGFAVIFLDLDRFKNVNDSLGHGCGDQLLVGFARRVEQTIRPGDTVARLGGDEFTILLEEIKDSNDIARVAERIRKSLQLPFKVDGQEIFVTVSMGLALGGAHERVEDLLRDADTALYRAKDRGRDCYEVFDPTMHARAVERLNAETDLRKALDRGEFLLHYQPIASMANESILGFEALLRWQHPSRGLLLPAQFLPIAEETGLILPIDLWVLRTACAQMRRWHERFPASPRFQVHVNLSTKHFSKPNMVSEIDRILKETGLDPRNLTLEITESVILEEFKEAIDALAGLKGLNVQLYLDDFGVGTFSLKGIHRPPIDSLKIHHSFVRALGKGSREAEVIQTITALAGNLNMGVIAEGVETRQELAELRGLQCGQVQGYLISKPLTVEAVEAFIAGR